MPKELFFGSLATLEIPIVQSSPEADRNKQAKNLGQAEVKATLIHWWYKRKHREVNSTALRTQFSYSRTWAPGS